MPVPSVIQAGYDNLRTALGAATGKALAGKAPAALATPEVRVRNRFDTEVVNKAKSVLTDFQYVTIPFPVEGGAADIDASQAITAYINTRETPTATSEASATSAAALVTKDNLLDVLLSQGKVIALKNELQDVVFNTRADDALGPPYIAGTGTLNLRADARPYSGDEGKTRFRNLLSFFYGEKMVQPCLQDNKAVYAHMNLRESLNEAEKTSLITAIITDFKPGDVLCSSLQGATASQASPAVGGRRNATRRKANRNQKARRRTR